MSVLSCDRYGCDHVMCNRVVDHSKYICENCYAELLVCQQEWPTRMTEEAIKRRLDSFMATEPGTYRVVAQEEDTDELLKRLVRERGESYD